MHCFLRVFDTLGFGALLIGDERKVLHFNRKAKEHLGGGLALRAHRLAATDPSADRLLQSVLEAHLSGQEEAREALGLPRREGRPLILRIVAFPDGVQAAFEGARLAILVADPEFCPDLPPELLPQVFGLTRREATVATQLMCGCSLQDIAEMTGIGVGTVRAQVKAILAKTRTKRQAELVGLLTRLAILAGRTT
ncbi:helix-turn-helix transcriptional regulator [Microvirga thermotolerans]|uniref:helix-turn-helix transcriptional regulator n=1 Tax=Microvirga thermotolerans TaxID=2651334 RepID=UPI001883D621|nr:helix-turn-helix transcriptional regulator [Microvirga thermotolerans]